jgi:hypothetical protein
MTASTSAAVGLMAFVVARPATDTVIGSFVVLFSQFLGLLFLFLELGKLPFQFLQQEITIVLVEINLLKGNSMGVWHALIEPFIDFKRGQRPSSALDN